MGDMMEALKGKKTYLVAIVAVGGLFCEMMGFASMPNNFYEILGFGGLASVRAGMKNNK